MLNAEELAMLYERHAREILAFLVARTCDPEVAVDILAETFALAFEKRDRFRGSPDSSGRAWLYAIARNQLTDFFRSERAQNLALERLGVQRRALTDIEYERIEELASTQELRLLVTEHVGQLPGDQQQALRLRLVDEEPYERIAELLGITQDAARARVSRGLRAVRAALVCIDDTSLGERTINHA
jgi:RNA polymerase sigma-70 factor (ECF subfamily)